MKQRLLILAMALFCNGLAFTQTTVGSRAYIPVARLDTQQFDPKTQGLEFKEEEIHLIEPAVQKTLKTLASKGLSSKLWMKLTAHPYYGEVHARQAYVIGFFDPEKPNPGATFGTNFVAVTDERVYRNLEDAKKTWSPTPGSLRVLRPIIKLIDLHPDNIGAVTVEGYIPKDCLGSYTFMVASKATIINR
jgi:hypothetical protein